MKACIKINLTHKMFPTENNTTQLIDLCIIVVHISTYVTDINSYCISFFCERYVVAAMQKDGTCLTGIIERCTEW